MCGIAGLADIAGGVIGGEALTVLHGLADILAHRGPDDREIVLNGPVGLAFTRLSLMDPAGGGQPLYSEDDALVLIANGEIYNHRDLANALGVVDQLKTGSDCEILLHLYRRRGLNFLDDVRGMFAMVLWDRSNNRLVLARDRFGIKPLYFHRNERRIVFASEIKALFVDSGTPRKVDWSSALTNTLVTAAPHFAGVGEATWFEDIHTVPAASIMVVDLHTGRTSTHRYWQLPEPGTGSESDDGWYIRRYGELLAEGVAEAATADANLGLFLSGGIDSAAVAALAKLNGHSLETFTALNASTYRNGDAEFGHRVAQHLGLDNHQVIFETGRVPDPSEWRRLLWLLETPLCGPEAFFKHELHRYAKLASPELRGILLGVGSDEFNGGYSVGSAEGGDWQDFDSNLRAMARSTALQEFPKLASWWIYGDLPLLRDRVFDRFARPIGDHRLEYLLWEHGKVQQYNCWIEDRTAAGSGIEARVPFLDHRLVELAVSVPLALRPNLLWDKQILRRAMSNMLPPQVVARPKVPFFYGSGQHYTYRMLVRMLAQNGGELVEQALAGADAGDLIDADAVHQTLDRLAQQPDTPQTEILLRLVNIGLLEQMVATLPKATVASPVTTALKRMQIDEWGSEGASIEERLGIRDKLKSDTVFSRQDNVLVTRAVDDSDTYYVAIDGSIEFELGKQELRHRQTLIAVDGERTVEDLADVLEFDLEELLSILRELQDLNVIGRRG